MHREYESDPENPAPRPWQIDREQCKHTCRRHIRSWRPSSHGHVVQSGFRPSRKTLADIKGDSIQVLCRRKIKYSGISGLPQEVIATTFGRGAEAPRSARDERPQGAGFTSTSPDRSAAVRPGMA